MHPHEIRNELRRILTLLELAHDRARGLSSAGYIDADDELLEDTSSSLNHVRELLEDELLGDELADELLEEGT